jgi:hypothetical protein
MTILMYKESNIGEKQLDELQLRSGHQYNFFIKRGITIDIPNKQKKLFQETRNLRDWYGCSNN